MQHTKQDNSLVPVNQKLLDNNKIFYKKYADLMKGLAENGQHPQFTFFSCTDSRNDPIHIFQLDPGDAFVFRSMGNIVPEYKSNEKGGNPLIQFFDAHIAFYIDVKKVSEIVMMGHTKCGAAEAIATGLDHRQISPWLIPAGKKILSRTKEKTEDVPPDSPEFLRALEEEMIIVSHENIISYPLVQEAIKKDKIKITSLLHELETGNLYKLNPKNKSFFVINKQNIKKPDCSCI